MTGFVHLAGPGASTPEDVRADGEDGEDGREGTAGGNGGSILNVRRDTPTVRRMLDNHEVMVLDGSNEDPGVREMLDRAGIVASVVAPLYAQFRSRHVERGHPRP